MSIEIDPASNYTVRCDHVGCVQEHTFLGINAKAPESWPGFAPNTRSPETALRRYLMAFHQWAHEDDWDDWDECGIDHTEIDAEQDRLAALHAAEQARLDAEQAEEQARLDAEERRALEEREAQEAEAEKQRLTEVLNDAFHLKPSNEDTQDSALEDE